MMTGSTRHTSSRPLDSTSPRGQESSSERFKRIPTRRSRVDTESIKVRLQVCLRRLPYPSGFVKVPVGADTAARNVDPVGIWRGPRKQEQHLRPTTTNIRVCAGRRKSTAGAEACQQAQAAEEARRSQVQQQSRARGRGKSSNVTACSLLGRTNTPGRIR